MILTEEQVEKITFGATAFSYKDGYIQPKRFNAKQIETYGRLRKDWGERTHCTAGICFDLWTDSDTLAFDALITVGTSRMFFYFDVMTDGVLTHHEGMEKYDGKAEFHFEVRLAKGRHRITVWFPNLSCASVKNVTVDDGAEITPFVHKKRMLSLGDSITHGYDAVFSSQAYPNIVAQERGYEVINQGIGGLNCRAEAVADYEGFTPDIVTVAIGTNDWNVKAREVFERDCTAMYDAIRREFPTQTLYAIIPIWRVDSERISNCGSFEECSEFIRSVAKAHNAVIIEGINALPHLPDFFSDRLVHPNDLGFRFYADAVLKVIE